MTAAVAWRQLAACGQAGAIGTPTALSSRAFDVPTSLPTRMPEIFPPMACAHRDTINSTTFFMDVQLPMDRLVYADL